MVDCMHYKAGRMCESDADKAEGCGPAFRCGFRNEWIDVLSVDKCLDLILGKMQSFAFALKIPV